MLLLFLSVVVVHDLLVFLVLVLLVLLVLLLLLLRASPFCFVYSIAGLKAINQLINQSINRLFNKTTSQFRWRFGSLYHRTSLSRPAKSVPASYLLLRCGEKTAGFCRD